MIACTAIAAALLAATPGSTITATGTCETPLRLPARDYAGVTLDMADAHVKAGMTASNFKRLTIKGGTWGIADGVMVVSHTIQVTNAHDFTFTDATVFTNGRNGGAGISVANGSRITIARNRFTGRNTGLGVRTVSDTVIDHNSITDSTADGINVTDSQRVVVSYNRCTDFSPAVGAHPDCVQLRNLAGKPLQSDVLLIGNVAIGKMQAFFGNCNRTTLISNYAALKGFTHTITCSGGVDNVAINNVLANTPDAPHGPGSLKGFANVYVPRNVLWDARKDGPAPMPLGVEP